MVRIPPVRPDRRPGYGDQVQIPGYRMPRPASRPDRETTASFDRLLDVALDHGPDRSIRTSSCSSPANPMIRSSSAPSCGVRRHRRDLADVLREPGPSRPPDAAGECQYRIRSADQLSAPHYFFSISRSALEQQPWRCGTVHLLPADSFET